MTKANFIALADALKAQRPADHWDPNKKAQWMLDVKAIANACKASSSKFKEDLWIAYVNGEVGPNGGKL